MCRKRPDLPIVAVTVFLSLLGGCKRPAGGGSGSSGGGAGSSGTPTQSATGIPFDRDGSLHQNHAGMRNLGLGSQAGHLHNPSINAGTDQAIGAPPEQPHGETHDPGSDPKQKSQTTDEAAHSHTQAETGGEDKKKKCPSCKDDASETPKERAKTAEPTGETSHHHAEQKPSGAASKQVDGNQGDLSATSASSDARPRGPAGTDPGDAETKPAHPHGNHDNAHHKDNEADTSNQGDRNTPLKDDQAVQDRDAPSSGQDKTAWAKRQELLLQVRSYAEKVPLSDEAFIRTFVESVKDLDDDKLATFVDQLKKVRTPVRKCPETGEDVGTMGPPLPVLVSGEVVLACCESCADAIKEEPEKHLAKIRTEAEKGKATTEEKPPAAKLRDQGICPVMDTKLGSMGDPVAVLVNGETIFVCCRGCVNRVKRNPELYLRKVSEERQGHASAQ